MRTDEEQTQDVLSDRLVATTSSRHLVVNAVVATLVLLAPIEYLLRLPGASTWRSSDTFLLVRNAILIVLIPCAVRLRNGGIPEPILSLPSKAEVAKGVKAASLLLLVVFVWTVPFSLMFAGHRQSRLPAHEVAALQALSNVSSFVLVSAGFASSLAAAVSEEVLFRFCLFALLSRAARRILVSAGCDSRRPSLWIGMVSQSLPVRTEPPVESLRHRGEGTGCGNLAAPNSGRYCACGVVCAQFVEHVYHCTFGSGRHALSG